MRGEGCGGLTEELGGCAEAVQPRVVVVVMVIGHVGVVLLFAPATLGRSKQREREEERFCVTHPNLYCCNTTLMGYIWALFWALSNLIWDNASI